jgi:hypothetical protein
MKQTTASYIRTSDTLANAECLQVASNHPSVDNNNEGSTLKSPLQVTLYEDLDSLPQSYEIFFQEVAKKDFFSSRAWLENIFNTTLEGNTRPRFYGVETNDFESIPQALLVFTSAAQNGAKIKGWWVKESAIAGTTNYLCYSHTFLYTDRTYDLSATTKALITQLKKDKYSLVDLNLFASESISLPILNQAFNDAGMKASTYEYCSNWVENTEHLDYQHYLSNRSKSTRKGTLRKKRRLQENHKVRFEILTQESDSEKAILLFDEVYAKSWKEPNYFQDFTPGLIRACAQQGTLRFGVLYIDDKAASVELCIAANDKATFAKSAYDPDYAEHSASSILLLHMIEHVISSDQAKLLSFGLFDDAYKKSWCQERRLINGIVAFNTHTFWGAIGFAAYSLGRLKDNILQRVKPPLKAIYKKYIQKKPIPK